MNSEKFPQILLPSYREYSSEEMINRPRNETPTMILVVGYPADGTMVPSIQKKKLDDIAMFR
jgi:hypothetical protein